MNIKLVVFDLGGTAIPDNKEVQFSLIHAFRTHGIEISPKEADQVVGIPKPVAIEHLLINNIEDEALIDDDLINKIHDSFIEEMIAFYSRDFRVREKRGVSETFKTLQEAGIKVAIDTEFDLQIVTPLIERLGWMKGGLVDLIVTPGQVDKGRPFPDMILKAMEITKITNPKEVVKVGDSPYDLIEGTAACCGVVVGVTTGAFSEDDLRSVHHSCFIEEIPEILNLLNVQKLQLA